MLYFPKEPGNYLSPNRFFLNKNESFTYYVQNQILNKNRDEDRGGGSAGRITCSTSPRTRMQSLNPHVGRKDRTPEMSSECHTYNVVLAQLKVHAILIMKT